MVRKRLKSRVLFIGAGFSGALAALEYSKSGSAADSADTVPTLLIDQNSEVIGKNSSSFNECYKLHLGVHYFGDPDTAEQCLEDSLSFASQFKEFLLGKPGDPWQRGTHLIMSNSVIDNAEAKARAVCEKLRELYKEKIEEDPTKKLFGEPANFIKYLKPSDVFRFGPNKSSCLSESILCEKVNTSQAKAYVKSEIDAIYTRLEKLYAEKIAENPTHKPFGELKGCSFRIRSSALKDKHIASVKEGKAIILEKQDQPEIKWFIHFVNNLGNFQSKEIKNKYLKDKLSAIPIKSSKKTIIAGSKHLDLEVIKRIAGALQTGAQLEGFVQPEIEQIVHLFDNLVKSQRREVKNKYLEDKLPTILIKSSKKTIIAGSEHLEVVKKIARALQTGAQLEDFIQYVKPSRHPYSQESVDVTSEINAFRYELKQLYENKIKENSKNKIFGEPDEFIERVAPLAKTVYKEEETSEEKAHVVLAIETPESQIDIKKFKRYLNDEVKKDEKIEFQGNLKVDRITYSNKDFNYVVEGVDLAKCYQILSSSPLEDVTLVKEGMSVVFEKCDDQWIIHFCDQRGKYQKKQLNEEQTKQLQIIHGSGTSKINSEDTEHLKIAEGIVKSLGGKIPTGEKVVIETEAVINCTWRNIERLNKQLGLYIPENRINRVKVSLLVKLPEHLEKIPTFIASLGPFISVTNQGDGTAILTYERVTNIGQYKAGSDILPDGLNAIDNNNLNPREGIGKDLANNIVAGCARFVPDLANVEVLQVRVGHVKMMLSENEEFSLDASDSPIHRRQEDGIEALDLLYFSLSGMKATRTMSNAATLTDMIEHNFMIKKRLLKLRDKIKTKLHAILQTKLKYLPNDWLLENKWFNINIDSLPNDKNGQADEISKVDFVLNFAIKKFLLSAISDSRLDFTAKDSFNSEKYISKLTHQIYNFMIVEDGVYNKNTCKRNFNNFYGYLGYFGESKRYSAPGNLKDVAKKVLYRQKSKESFSSPQTLQKRMSN